MTIQTRAFRPFDQRTYRLAATAASTNINFTNDGSNTNSPTMEVRVYNNGAAVTFVRFGVDSTVTAVVPTAGTGTGVASGDIAIAPGGTFTLRVAPDALWMAGITGTNGDVYVTGGRG